MRRVDDAIFTRRYFGECMRCGFCRDECCTHGVDVAVVERDRILARADELEALVGVPRDRWFAGTHVHDADFPGGRSTRTTVIDGACVFLQRGARGCVLHAVTVAAGEDHHALKPMVSALFPVTFDDGALQCSNELRDGSLVCAGEGPSAYDMARTELGYYFGPALVEELDVVAARLATTRR